MPITRSYGSAFEIVDWTTELNIIPLAPTILNDSGLFREEMLSTHTVTFEEIGATIGLIGDSYRGSKPQANTDDTRKIRSYPLAHFGIVDAVKPQDIQGRSAYGQVTAAETEAAVMMRKMERITQKFSQVLEAARFSTLTTGLGFAPNGTISVDFFSDFGVTQKSVNFALGTAGTDVVAKVEEVIAHIQDNANTGQVVMGVIGYVSPEFFAAFISHAKVQAAYQYFAATENQMIQRNRAGGAGLYREFTYGGVRLIEVRQSINGTRLVPANEAVFVPMGLDDCFKTFYGPANKLDLVNTIAQRTYMFSNRDPKGESVEIEASSDFLNALLRPALVVKGVKS